MQSNIIAQEAEFVENPNISDKESVTTENLKTVAKSSKSKNVTKQPNKIKLYAELKAANCTLILDIIKRHILPKKCPQR